MIELRVLNAIEKSWVGRIGKIWEKSLDF